MIKNRELVNDICFPVATLPIFHRLPSGDAISIPNIDNFQAVVKSGSNQVLGVTTTKYGVLENGLVFGQVFDCIDDLGLDATVEDVYSNKNDSRHRVKINFPELVCDPGDGHRISYQLIIQNGYDGTYNFGFQHGAFRLVCTNGMMIGTKVQDFSKKHSTSIESVFEEILNNLKLILPNAPQIIADGTHKLLNTANPYKAEDLGLVIADLASLPAKYHQDLPGSYWDGYNRLTDAISHDDRKRSGFRADQLLGNVHEAFNKVMHMKATDFEEKLAEIRLAA